MTSYHFSIGYNGGRGCRGNPWETLKTLARRLCDDPKAIIAEARRLNAPETCEDGCCNLETYADNYLGEFGTTGHPITIKEREGEDRDPEVIQWASCADEIKYRVRRAFARLLIESAHHEGIEVNLRVS